MYLFLFTWFNVAARKFLIAYVAHTCGWNSVLFLPDSAALDTQPVQLLSPNGQHCHLPSNRLTPEGSPQATGAQGPATLQEACSRPGAKRDGQTPAVHHPLVPIYESVGQKQLKKQIAYIFLTKYHGFLNFNSQTYHKVAGRLYSNKSPGEYRLHAGCFSTEVHTQGPAEVRPARLWLVGE